MPRNIWSNRALALADSPVPAKVMRNIDAIIAELVAKTQDGDAVVIMSNGGFGGIHGKLVAALKN